MGRASEITGMWILVMNNRYDNGDVRPHYLQGVV